MRLRHCKSCSGSGVCLISISIILELSLVRLTTYSPEARDIISIAKVNIEEGTHVGSKARTLGPSSIGMVTPNLVI